MSDIHAVLTVDDVLAYLGIDYADDMVTTNINRAIETAHGELRESVGDDYPETHPLTKELALIYADVSYNQRDMSANEEKRADQIALKLRLVLRRGSNGATV